MAFFFLTGANYYDFRLEKLAKEELYGIWLKDIASNKNQQHYAHVHTLIPFIIFLIFFNDFHS